MEICAITIPYFSKVDLVSEMLPTILLSQLHYQYYFKAIYFIIKQARVAFPMRRSIQRVTIRNFLSLCTIGKFMVYLTTTHKIAIQVSMVR